MNTLIDRIQEQMLSDDVNRETESVRLKRYYDKSNANEKELIDNIFISLCGWSLQTLIENKI